MAFACMSKESKRALKAGSMLYVTTSLNWIKNCGSYLYFLPGICLELSTLWIPSGYFVASISSIGVAVLNLSKNCETPNSGVTVAGSSSLTSSEAVDSSVSPSASASFLFLFLALVLYLLPFRLVALALLFELHLLQQLR